MDDQATLTQAIGHYRLIDRLSLEIEQVVQARTFAALPALCAHMDASQEEAKGCDGAVLDCLRQSAEHNRSAEIAELLALMQRIETRNRLMMPHINSIMAVQRNELHRLQRGNSVLQGYRPDPAQTGRRLSSSG